MKKILLSFLLLAVVLLTVVMGSTAATTPRVSRATLTAMEKSLDGRISRLWQDNPFLLLGTTRGVYLDGYGAVFTAEINLVANPISLMQATLTKEDIAKHRQKKLERIPILKKALSDALVSTAASLDTVPLDESITIVAFLPHYSWEDISGVPAQIMVQGQKKKVLEAQHAGAAALEAAVHVSEN